MDCILATSTVLTTALIDSNRGAWRSCAQWTPMTSRARAAGWQVALLSPDQALERQLGIPLRLVARTTNGGIPVRLVVGQVRAD